MVSLAKTEMKKDHAVLVPFPAQGHVNPMMKLAKLLHGRGLHVTFVNTEYNHRRLLKSRGGSSLEGSSSFRFATIPDGLPFSDEGDAARQDFVPLIRSMFATSLGPFMNLVTRLNDDDDVPLVSCIVWDSMVPFALLAAEELCIPNAHFWAGSACGFLPHLYLPHLVRKGLVPVPVPPRGESCLTREDLDGNCLVDLIPGMKNMRWKDYQEFITSADPTNVETRSAMALAEMYNRASALILNTFDALEQDSLSSISSLLPCPVYSIGPLHLLETHRNDANLFEEETNCLQWLDAKEPYSVLYVNFGTTAKMTPDQVEELAWGIANSGKNFLWAIRPSALPIPSELLESRGLVVSWCSQVDVLDHKAIGGFFTHCGWNSVAESICAGVPMICWPFMADQHPNRRYCCAEWGIGLEIDGDDVNVKRDDVEKVVREMMEGEICKEMKKKVSEWKEVARQATKQGSGSSWNNLDKLITHLSKNSTD